MPLFYYLGQRYNLTGRIANLLARNLLAGINGPDRAEVRVLDKFWLREGKNRNGIMRIFAGEN
jgi:hypothetical protein